MLIAPLIMNMQASEHGAALAGAGENGTLACPCPDPRPYPYQHGVPVSHSRILRVGPVPGSHEPGLRSCRHSVGMSDLQI